MTVPTLPSRIKSVTVYRSEATITRVSEIDLSETPVPEVVQVVGLPLCLYDSSVTAKVRPAGDGAVPEACDVRIGLDVPPPESELPAPHCEALREAERTVAELEAQLEQVDRMVLKLQGLKAPERPRGERGKAPPPAPTDARIALLEFRQCELDKLGERRRTLRVELEEARDVLDVVRRRDAAASTARQTREHELRKSVVVTLRVPDGAPLAPSCRLEIEYLVPGARWVPSYAIRATETDDSAELEMRAQLCQHTGEDWVDVTLRVATADPERWSELPELPALRIGRRQPLLPKTGWRPAPTGAEGLFLDYDRAAASQIPPPHPSDTGSRSITLDSCAATRPAVFGDFAESEQFARASLEDASDTGAFLTGGAESEEPDEFELRGHEAPSAAMPVYAVKAARFVPSLRRSPPEASVPSDAVIAGMPPPQPEQAQLAASKDMLDYKRLRLGGARDRDRGVLRPLTQEESYLEYSATVQVNVDIDLTYSLAVVASRANSVAAKDPPQGYAAPEAWEGFDYAYSADTAVSVPSDSKFHNVPLSSGSAAIELRYVTVPRESLEVYRFLTLANPFRTPLPEGPADVYVNGDYLLTSRLHTVAPAGTIELGLGVEGGVKAARNVRFSEHTSGILGGNLRLSHTIVIDLANNLPKTADVEVRERVPTIREGDDKVSVRIIDVDPPWDRFDQERRQIEGAYRWRLDVPSASTRTLQVEYEIAISAKHEIVGGNRREE